jgi:hypothetical protein
MPYDKIIYLFMFMSMGRDSLRTVATNEPIVHSTDDIWVRSLFGILLTGKHRNRRKICRNANFP